MEKPLIRMSSPLALVAILLPDLITFGQPIILETYAGIFAAQNILFNILITIVLWAIFKRWQSNRSVSQMMSAYTQSIIVLSPLMLWRYDIFPTLLSVLGLYAFLTRRSLLAGIFIGAGTAIKLYPAVMLPVFCLYYWVKHDKRALYSLCFGCIMLLGLVGLLSTWISQGQVIIAIRYQQQRGLQIESVGAGLVSLCHLLGLGKVAIEHNFNAFHLASPLADITLTILTVVCVIGFIFVLTRCLYRFRGEQAETGEVSFQSLVGYITMMLLVFLACYKVFSPQFLLWVLPFVVLLSNAKARLLLVICLLSIAIYPLLYLSLLAQQPFAVLLLNLRNVLVVTLLLWVIYEFRKGREFQPSG
jgi:hypothetical protein